MLDEVEASPSGSWVEPSRVGNIPSGADDILSNARLRVEQSIAAPAATIASPGKFVSRVIPASGS